MARAPKLVSVAAALCVIAGAVTPGALGATPHSSAMAALAPQLPWLHVSHAGGAAGALPVIEDSSGRQVILRGVDLVGLEDDFYMTPNGAEPGTAPFWPVSPSAYIRRCPTNSHQITEPPVCEVSAGMPEWQQSAAPGSLNDLAQMRALGFNVIRLPVSWSQLEPTPGRYDTSYIDRIAQVVGWAASQGIYSVIDMHQDDYSRFTPASAPLSTPGGVVGPTAQSGGHADGAPRWAVMASGVPAEGVDGQGVLNAYVEAAFTSFWENRIPTAANGEALPQGEAPGPGLQDHYIGAVAALVSRFAGDPAVAGFELMNEPLPGFIAPGVFDQGYLYPFYRRVIDAVTGEGGGLSCPVGTAYQAACGYRDLGIHDTRHMYFVEPMAARDLTDAAVGLSAPFTAYPNVVYAPHVYTHVFTADTFVPSPLGALAARVFPVGYRQALVTAGEEARLIGAALWIGEYGDSNDQDASILSKETAELDRAGVGSALWSWKANCGPGLAASRCEPALWSMFYGSTATPPAQNGAIIASRLEYVSRAYPRAVVGSIRSFAYDPASGTFSLNASYTGTPVALGRSLNALLHDTVVFVPKRATGAVHATGAAHMVALAVTPDGNRLVFEAPTGAGAYGLTVG